MPSRRAALVALLCAACALGGVAGWLTCRAHQRRAEAPRTVASLIARAEAARLQLHSYPQAPSGLLGGGVFLTESPRDVAGLRRLRRQAGRASCW